MTVNLVRPATKEAIVGPQKKETLLFVGYARLPGNIALGPGIEVLCLEIEVDPSVDIIVNVACCGIPALGAQLVLDVLLGFDLKQTLSGAEYEIQSRFYGPAQKAVISALGRAYEGYLRYKTRLHEESDKPPLD